jgi:RNA polymerase sigma-54 factor
MTAQLSQHHAAAPLMQLSPALVAFAQLLELPSAQLEELVVRELEQNPALERDETPVCFICGEPLRHGVCWACGDLERSVRSGSRLHDVSSERGIFAPDITNDRDELLVELRSALPREEAGIADFVVGCLDEHGILSMGAEEISAALGVAGERVDAVIATLKRGGPPGVGARDVRELLLLQLDGWEADHSPQPLVRTVISDHFDLLACGDRAGLVAAIPADHAQVDEVVRFIREHLRPSPALDLSTRDPVGAMPPDLVIRKRPDRPGTYAVELLEPRRIRVSICASYRRYAPDRKGARLREGLRSAHAASPDIDRSGEDFSRVRARAAAAFLSRLEQRWRTVRLVAEHLVDVQREFLAAGPAFLVPLTRADVAHAIGLHESTVSRAISGRHALLPSRQVVPLAYFVTPSLGARETLRQLIRAESRPLSDGELVVALAGHGLHLARRTVAKYRTELAIPVADRRRRPAAAEASFA